MEKEICDTLATREDKPEQNRGTPMLRGLPWLSFPIAQPHHGSNPGGSAPTAAQLLPSTDRLCYCLLYGVTPMVNPLPALWFRPS